MGNFCTITMIHNKKQLNRKDFAQSFCNAMETKGYFARTPDSAELSYGIVFSENSDWVTIGLLGDDQMSQEDPSGWLSAALHTCCIHVTVVDSDFAVLELYQEKAEAADMAILGDASGYMDEEISRGTKECWEPLLKADNTWEQLQEIFESSYVYAEDGLDQMAALLGMDMEGISMDWREMDEENPDTIILHFEKNGMD